MILIIGSIELFSYEKLSAIEFNFINSCNAILVKITLGKYHFNTHPHPPTVKKIMVFFSLSKAKKLLSNTIQVVLSGFMK